MRKKVRGALVFFLLALLMSGIFAAFSVGAESAVKGDLPKLEFTRMLSSTHVKKGWEVTITYRVRNTCELSLYNLSLEDELCGVVGEIESLDPGARESFVKKVVIEKTSVSRPTVTFKCEGIEEELSERLKAATIYLANEQLDRLLAADKTSVAPGELVTLRLTLVNRGNVAYDDLRISDASLGEIGIIPGELKPGDEYTFVKTVSLKSTTTFQFDIVGRGSGGSEIFESSNMLTIAVSPAVENMAVTVNTIARPSYLAAPGEMMFVITIVNEGDVDIRNAVLLELGLGELKNLAVLAPGETTIEYLLDVETDNSYVFMVQLTDSNDRHMTVLSEPVEVVVDENGAQRPEETQKPPNETDFTHLTGSPRKLDPSKYYEQMLLWGLLVVSMLVLCLLYAYSGKGKRRHRRKKRRGKAFERTPDNSDNPDFADTKPHPPVGINRQERDDEG